MRSSGSKPFHELAKLLQSYVRAPKGTFSSLAYSSLDSSFESKMPSDLRTSYLLVFSVHSARPPKQLEHPRHWVLQLRCGQDYWVFQQYSKHRLRQLFVFVPSNLPLSFCEASQAGGIRKDLGMRTRAWAEISAIWADPRSATSALPGNKCITGFRWPLIFQIGCNGGLHR